MGGSQSDNCFLPRLPQIVSLLPLLMDGYLAQTRISVDQPASG